jgi:hydroxymethylbilane synthase
VSARLKLGTRGSELARTQSETVADSLRALGFDVELAIIRTSGDHAATVPFASIGPQGVFVREIEQALVDGRVDLAVHSYKDMPTKSPAELVVAAVPPRIDAADRLLVRADSAARAAAAPVPAADGLELPLPRGARVGTASARRRAWLLHFRPDLVVEPLRGNVPTRVRKLEEPTLDAIVLAAAGLDRLHGDAALGALLAGLTILRLEPRLFVPAPAQGALAVQCRRDAEDVVTALAMLDDTASRAAVTAERVALARAEGGCDVAFGAHCIASGTRRELYAMLERGGRVHAAHVVSEAGAVDPDALGADAWRELDAALEAAGALR